MLLASLQCCFSAASLLLSPRFNQLPSCSPLHSACPQAKLADNEAKHTKFTERLAHERSKRGEYDKELKKVEEEFAKAEKALEAASRKAEAAAAAMKELEQRDVKVRQRCC
jgi:septal ring factor EnvC (AmiA/AmiB activator)